ncbi:MAG TPA: protein kinase [Burkholderiales bacterium]|nr:protein kinase [Burkholderiales bacterium]
MDLKTLGRYRILGELGRGAMGAVYRALDPLIEREVAIKTLLPDLPTEVMEEVRERFIREARSAGRLSHPNIVTIYDVGEQDGIAYIAMELLNGHSLLQVLKHPQRLAFNTIANVIAQVADALDMAQQHNIVHRDVKPANIMVDNAGRVRLTDFGVAYVPASTITGNGTALGSPRYMSPEQVTGAPIDPRSDIFSLGVVLYELLTKRTPFEHEGDTTIFALMNRIASTPHPPVREVDPSVPAPFEHIVDRALAKKAAERYTRAGEMARELRDFRNIQPRSTPARLALAGEPSGGHSSGVRVDAVHTQLINDLDKFVEQYDLEEQERLHDEEAQQRRKEDQMRRWGEERAREREAFERSRQNPAAAATGELDAAMRAALQQLTGLAQQLNSVRPAAARPYEFLYLGRLPKVSISEAAVESQPRALEGQSVPGRICLRFRITPKPAVTVTLVGDDVERCEQYLKLLKVSYTQRALPKNGAGKALRAELSVTGSLPCEIEMKADYGANKVAMELTNVRRLGRVAYQLAPRAFSEAVGHLGHYLLGGDDDFEAVARGG